MARKSLAAFDRLDVLVNNASTFIADPIRTDRENSWDQPLWEQVIASNVRAPLMLAKILAPALTDQCGAIVNIAAHLPRETMRLYPTYSAAKGALTTATRSLALALAPRVRVNAVAPGLILWPENRMMDENSKKKMLQQVPAARCGTVRDIALAVLFLAGRAGYITGQTLIVDGGRSLIR